MYFYILPIVRAATGVVYTAYILLSLLKEYALIHPSYSARSHCEIVVNLFLMMRVRKTRTQTSQDLTTFSVVRSINRLGSQPG